LRAGETGIVEVHSAAQPGALLVVGECLQLLVEVGVGGRRSQHEAAYRVRVPLNEAHREPAAVGEAEHVGGAVAEVVDGRDRVAA
jgi:hypothetical protein